IEIVNRKGGRITHPVDTTLNDSGVSDASQGEDEHGGDRVHVITHPRLVNANEIEVLKPTVLEHARPVLTPGEQLRRDDQIILSALLDKQRILAQTLPGTPKVVEELEKIADQFSGMGVTDLKQRDTKEVALSAIVQGNRLLDAINEGMNLKKQEQKRGDGQEKIELAEQDFTLPTVACYRLTAIAAPLMNHLKAMMQVVQEQQDELKTVRSELLHYKDMAERQSNRSVSMRSGSDETLTGSTTAEGSGSKATSPCGGEEHENGRRKSETEDKEAEAKRKERLLQKRQRNVGLVGGDDPRTSPEKTA
uniref:Uncharacterized protein n=2 Tax=Plectus sambesii TaxID=2011161 RepID=A0A914WX14_9BILA